MVDPLALRQAVASRRAVTGRPVPRLGVSRRPVPALRPLGGVAPVAEAKQDDGPDGFWGTAGDIIGDVGDTLTGLGPGLWQMGQLAARSAVAPVRAAVDLARGDVSLQDAAAVTAGAPFLGLTTSGLMSQPARERYLPLQREMYQSGSRTASNLRHPTHYTRALDRGEIVNTVLEDAGNLSLIGGVAAKALGAGSRAAAAAGNAGRAASLERAAEIASTGTHVVDVAANAPFHALNQVVKGSQNLITKGVEAGRLLDEGTIRGGLARTIGERAPLAFTEAGRALNPQLKLARREVGRAKVAPLRELYREVAKTGITDAEQGVATALRTGIADQFKLLLDDGLTVDQAQEIIARRNVNEQTFTPAVAAATAEYVTGAASPETVARIDSYRGVVDDLVGKQTDRALTGEGRLNGPMDPRYLGTDVLPERVDVALREGAVAEGRKPFGLGAYDPLGTWTSYDDIQKQIRDDPTMADFYPEDIEGYIHPDDAHLGSAILDNPGMYPAKMRPAMLAAGRTNDAYLESLTAPPGTATAAPSGMVPLRPQEMLDAGLPEPDYLPGGRSELADPRSARNGRVPLREGIRPLRGLRSENFRATSETQPFSARTVGEALGNEAAITTGNQALIDMMQDPKLRTVEDIIPRATRDQFRLEAQAEARRQRGGPGELAQTEAQRYGELVNDELAKRGYEPLGGDRVNPGIDDFDPDAAVPFSDVRDGMLVLPKGLKDRLVPHMVTKDVNKFWQGLEIINRKFKGAVLPFSVRWQLGDFLGGAFMAAVGGGVPPWELIDNIRKRKRLTEAETRAIFDHPEFQDAGLNFEEAAWARNGPDARQPKTFIGKGQRASFRVNAAINKANRQGYLLAKVQRLLEERGLSIDDVTNGPGWDDPQVQSAIKTAIDDANTVMGTFDELTPFEQRVMKNAFPFWVWNRHVSKLAWRTAIDHPARMMWTMRLGSLATSDQDALPWLKGSIQIGNALVPTNYFNPFNDVGGGSIATPAGAARAVSPGIKVGLGGLFGWDLNNGGQQFTRPFGTGNTDSLGRDTFTPLLANPGEMAYLMLRQIPQTREGLNLLPTGEIAGVGLGPHPRYGQGSLMVNRQGQPIDTNSRWRNVAGMFGLPTWSSASDAEQIQATKDKRLALRAKRAANTQRYEG